MLWCRSQPTAPSCVNHDARFMLVSLKLLRTSLLRLPKAGPSCWLVTPLRPVRSKKPPTLGQSGATVTGPFGTGGGCESLAPPNDPPACPAWGGVGAEG